MADPRIYSTRVPVVRGVDASTKVLGGALLRGEIAMTTKNAAAVDKSLYELALKVIRRKRPDLMQASALLEQAHEQGDPRATYALATWLLSGNAIYPQDLRKAVKLLKLAAKADIAAAHFDLAVSYETGQGIKKDDKAAYRHFLAAALNGDNASLAEVGRCHYHGIGIVRDRKVAEVWLRRADVLAVDVR